MVKQIFVNLPVKDLNKTKEFWTKLGFGFDPQFTDEKAAALVIGPNMFAMLLTEEFFGTFSDKQIADTSKTTEVHNALQLESREEVDKMLADAVAAGGKKSPHDEDYEWMYGRGFEDLDGHAWGVFAMDINKFPKK